MSDNGGADQVLSTLDPPLTTVAYVEAQMAGKQFINSPDLTGQVFGRLTVLGRERIRRHNWHWRCMCSCGTPAIVTSNRLNSGYTQSCGCLFLERVTTHGMSRTRTYRIWMKARSRCSSATDPNYPNYGGRGIYVCDRWQSFENFLADMGPAAPGMTLERDNVNGNYCPDNCRWIPKAEQNRNTRRTKRVILEGVEMLLADALREIRRRAF